MRQWWTATFNNQKHSALQGYHHVNCCQWAKWTISCTTCSGFMHLCRCFRVVSLLSSSWKSSIMSPSTYDSCYMTTWILTPEATQSAQKAKTIVSRFIKLSMSQNRITMPNLRCHPLSRLVPIFLHAAFNLQHGRSKVWWDTWSTPRRLCFTGCVACYGCLWHCCHLVCKKLYSFDFFQDKHISDTDHDEWLHMCLSTWNNVSSGMLQTMKWMYVCFKHTSRYFESLKCVFAVVHYSSVRYSMIYFNWNQNYSKQHLKKVEKHS